MKNQENLNQISFSTVSAICTFLFGTILLIYYVVFPNDGVLLFGIYYIFFAMVYNLIILAFLIYQLITISEERKHTIIQILIMVANVPIAILYFGIVTNLLFPAKG